MVASDPARNRWLIQNQANWDFNNGTISKGLVKTIMDTMLLWLPPLGLKGLRKGRFWAPTESSDKGRATTGDGMQTSLWNWKGVSCCNKHLHLPLHTALSTPPSPVVSISWTQPEGIEYSDDVHMGRPSWLGVDGWKVGLKGVCGGGGGTKKDTLYRDQKRNWTKN